MGMIRPTGMPGERSAENRLIRVTLASDITRALTGRTASAEALGP